MRTTPAAILFAIAASAVMAQPATTTKKDPPTATQPAGAAASAKHSAVTPVSKENEAWWKQRHESFNARAKQGAANGDIDLIFVGDSITQGWETDGKAVWEQFYTPRHAFNIGVSGDRTQHVLWRLENGNITGLAKPAKGHAPKLIVMMIGTNNSNGKDNTAEEIADGQKAIIAKFRKELPDTKILMLAIFPRGEKPNAQREKNAQASALASNVADGKMVHYLDIGPAFLESDGTLSKLVMPDALHLSPEGYKRWAEAIEPKVKELLGEKNATAPKEEKPKPAGS